jgi:GTP-binding protein
MKIKNSYFLKGATRAEHWPPPEAPEVAFVGRSNVGKSSLLNVLVQRHKLVKVSNTPGRTREINFFVSNIQPAAEANPRDVVMVDLPGYGYARVPGDMRREWGPMIESYLRERVNLCAVVMLLDVRRDPEAEEQMLLDFFQASMRPVIIVTTKCDKLSRTKVLQRQRVIAQPLGCDVRRLVSFSSLSKDGFDTLWSRIVAHLPPLEAPPRVIDAADRDDAPRTSDMTAPTQMTDASARRGDDP